MKYLVYILVFLITGCVKQTQFYITAQSDNAEFSLDDTVKLFSVNNSIAERNAMPHIRHALYVNGIDTDNNDDSEIVFWYSFNDQTFISKILRPLYGKTRISSIDTASNTSGTIDGTLYAPGAYSGNNFRYDGALTTTTNTSSTINYDYGITGYETDYAQQNYTYLNLGVVKKGLIIGSYTVGAFNATQDYILAYLPYLLPTFLGSNANGMVGIGCTQKRLGDDFEVKCMPNGVKPSDNSGATAQNVGMAISNLFIMSSNS